MKNDSKKLKILLAVLGIILVLLIVFTSFIAIQAVQNSQVPKVEVESTNTSALSKETEVMFLEEPIIANVGNRLIVKAVIGFEVDSKSKQYKDFLEIFESKQIIIRNEIIELFRMENPSEIIKENAQQVIGEKIKNRINELLGQEMITDVYFGEFFVQG